MLSHRKLGTEAGLIVGFALKKIAKLFIIVLGIFIIPPLHLGIDEVISINYDAL